jgi:hypothetical protein
MLDASQSAALQQEIAALRRHRYSPGLTSYVYVPPGESISGWVVTGMARPPMGGTPSVTISIREAVGNQYLTVIPRTDPQVFTS